MFDIDIDIDVAYVDIVWHKIKICKPEGQKLRILLKLDLCYR